jgi:PEP-CTERM motif
MGLLILLCGFQSISAYGQVVATWTGGSGNWSNAANWSSNPSEPINGADSATIATPGSSVVFDIPYASINSLTLGTTDSLSIKAAKYLQVESTVNSGVFANNGYFSVGGSGSGFSNYGTVLNASGATFESEYRVYNYGGFTNSGQLEMFATTWNYGTFTNYGNVTNNLEGNMLNYGAFTNYGTFNGCCGTINYAGGTITNYGAIDIPEFSFTNNGVLNNSGAINNAATMNNATGANFTNFGTVTTTGTINNSGNFTNFGAVTISNSGLFTTSTNYLQMAGSTLVNGTLTATGSAIVNIQGGTLGGTGTINGNVAMGGTLTPGAPGTPGTLTIVGNYEQLGNGTLEELIGPVSQSSLNVIGGVALDSGASLDIALLNGYDPVGQTFDIMNYSSLVGQFSNGSSFWDDGYLWDVSYGQNQIDVRAVQVPEPSSLSLLLIGLAALAFCAHRSRINTQHLS